MILFKSAPGEPFPFSGWDHEEGGGGGGEGAPGDE